jgi:hypothetical protein
VGSEDNLSDLELEEENAEEYYSADYLTKKFEPAIKLLRQSGNNKEVAQELIDEINEVIEGEGEGLESLKEKLEEAQQGAKSPWGGTSHFKPGVEKALKAIAQIQTEEGIGDYANLDASTGSDAGRESVDGEVRGEDMMFSPAAEDLKSKGKSPNAASRESDSSRATGDDDPIMQVYHRFANVKKQLLKNAIPGLTDEDIHKIHDDQERVKEASKNKGILEHSKSDDISFHQRIAAKFTQSSENPNGFRPVEWDKGHVTESRQVTERKSKIVGNDDLVEKTKMTEVNGKKMNARVCNFPDAINEGTGPLHLSIILKDENGKNMEKSKAVYFTAHYDSQGKLKEMTYPIPIQFAESGQGFFIRDNKTYTLPIDKKTFVAMQMQMDINRSNTRDTSEKELGGDLILQAGSKDAANRLRSRLDSSFSVEEVGRGTLVDPSLKIVRSDNGSSNSSSSKPSSSKDGLLVDDAAESISGESSGSLSKAPNSSSIETREPEHVVIPSNSGSAIDAGGLALKAPESSSIGNSKHEHPAISSSSGANSVELVVSKAPESSSGAASSSLGVGLGDDSVRIANILKDSLSHSSSSSLSSFPNFQPKAPASFQVPEAEDKKTVTIGEKQFNRYNYKDVNVYIDNGHVYEVPSKVAEKREFKAIHHEADKAYQEFLKPKKKDGATK